MLSLLWPEQSGAGLMDFSGCSTDLELGELGAIAFQGMRAVDVLAYTAQLTSTDTEVLQYRQECIRDLRNLPLLREAFVSVAEHISEMKLCMEGIRENTLGLTNHGGLSSFKETLDKLENLFGSKSNMIDENDLDNYYGQLFRSAVFTFRLAIAYTTVIQKLRDALRSSDVSCLALTRLRETLDELYIAEETEASITLLQKLSAEWDNIRAFSVDVLVDQSLNITGLELLSVEPQPYAKEGVLTARNQDAASGLARLAEFPQGGATARFQECLITAVGTALRGKLVKLRDAVRRIPVRHVRELVTMGDELPFYTAAVQFFDRIEACGLPVCCPEMADDSVLLHAEQAYPVSAVLLHGREAVGNDIHLASDGAMQFLTGANSSGKTTILITAGQLLWLYHLGWWLPCRAAQLRPAAGVYTLFASGESEEVSDSRMGLEVQKLEQIRSVIRPGSIVLMNEPMTSTSAGEGIQICMDFLTEFITGGISGMIVTHFNEMYSMLCTRLEAAGCRQKLISYVMEIDRTDDGITYPYRMVCREPGRSSYAGEIVSKVGIELHAMLQKLSAAGLDMRPQDACWQQLHEEG